MKSLFVIEANRVLLNKEEGEPVVIKGGITSEGFSIIHIFNRGWHPFGYLRDKYGIWWFDGRKTKVTLVSKETTEFRVLDDDYGLASEHVYLEDKLILGADPATFILLPGSPYFAKDKHRLYVKSGDRFHTWDDIDVATTVAHLDFCTDKDHVFHLFDSLSYANGSKDELSSWLRETYPDIHGWWHPDYENTEEGAEQIRENWYRTNYAVFYCEEIGSSNRKGTRTIFNLVKGADPVTFEVLSDQYGRDKESIYCHWRKVSGADAMNFNSLGGLFGSDAENIFYNGYMVAEADRTTFRCLLPSGHLGLSKDALNVYHAQFVRTDSPFGHPDYILKPITGADPESFELLSEQGSWAVDRNAVYQWGNLAKKLDRASFVYLFDEGPESWAVDRQGLYNANGRRTVKGIDGASFRMLNRYWGTDDQSVFCFVTGAVQRAADAATFRVTNDRGGAEDKDFHYEIKDNGTIRKTKKK
ncbi:DKNYY domain-containing protein [Paenibacillus sp. ACRRY]|uniref:DKNYY domain-containing protein n=1 Tax=Paenibacillus sp. ACRRY TaxID=2918208 RepID=UPI001EF6E94C|nr:DKNYY domain-containing protein [Paenibacillus sp. ACRRY]MCG7381318.1 DKNYY domain-containing protein [Paenibacillus sp. ACRRY]